VEVSQLLNLQHRVLGGLSLPDTGQGGGRFYILINNGEKKGIFGFVR